MTRLTFLLYSGAPDSVLKVWGFQWLQLVSASIQSMKYAIAARETKGLSDVHSQNRHSLRSAPCQTSGRMLEIKGGGQEEQYLCQGPLHQGPQTRANVDGSLAHALPAKSGFWGVCHT